MKNAPGLTLLGEASRYKVLAAEAALRAVLTEDPADRAREEQLAREHVLRSETYRAAARLIDGTKK